MGGCVNVSLTLLFFGKKDPEEASLPLLALDFHLGAVKKGNVLHQGEPQPRPPLAAGAGGVDHVEAVEDPWLVFRRDSQARILNLRHQSPPILPRSNDDPAVVGVLDRVVHKVDEKLFQLEGVRLENKRLLRKF